MYSVLALHWDLPNVIEGSWEAKKRRQHCNHPTSQALRKSRPRISSSYSYPYIGPTALLTQIKADVPTLVLDRVTFPLSLEHTMHALHLHFKHVASGPGPLTACVVQSTSPSQAPVRRVS